MGSPKALLKIGEETFLQCIIRKGREAAIATIILVAGRDYEKICVHVPPDVMVVRNENYQRGQISSLQTGIRALPGEVDAIAVWPVDQPLVQTDTLRKLMDASKLQEITVPVYQGQKGHPVIYSHNAMQWALQLENHQTGKDLHSQHIHERLLVEVNDPGILIDIDTPEDYAKHITT